MVDGIQWLGSEGGEGEGEGDRDREEGGESSIPCPIILCPLMDPVVEEGLVAGGEGVGW